MFREARSSLSKKHKNISDDKTIYVLRRILFDMEPELRTLEGAVAILRALSTTADQIEPIALAPLAYLSAESLDKILDKWRQGIAAVSGKAAR